MTSAPFRLAVGLAVLIGVSLGSPVDGGPPVNNARRVMHTYMFTRVLFIANEAAAYSFGEKIADDFKDSPDLQVTPTSKTYEDLRGSTRYRSTDILRIRAHPEGRDTFLILTFAHQQDLADREVKCGTITAEDCATMPLKRKRIADIIREHHRRCHESSSCDTPTLRRILHR